MWENLTPKEKLIRKIQIFLWLLWVAIAFTAMLLTTESIYQ